MTTNPWDIGGEGGNSFPFDRVGDQITGQIRNLQEVQQTDLQTGDPKTFANGDPMMMYRVTLATQLRDPANPTDNGERNVYLKGSRKSGCESSLAAVLDAVRAATGSTALEPNATVTLQYIGDGPQQQRGFNPPKRYAASYQRPAMDLGGPQQPAPVQQYAQPPQQPAPVQQYAQPPQQPAPVQQYAQPPQQPPATYSPAQAQQTGNGWGQQQPAAPAPQAVYQQPAPAPAPQYAPPAPQQPAAPAAPPAGAPSAAQLAALQAACVDPATVFPGYQPA